MPGSFSIDVQAFQAFIFTILLSGTFLRSHASWSCASRPNPARHKRQSEKELKMNYGGEARGENRRASLLCPRDMPDGLLWLVVCCLSS